MVTLSTPAVNLEPYILRPKPAGTAYRVEKMDRKCWVQAHARDHELRTSLAHKDCGYRLEGCMGNFMKFSCGPCSSCSVCWDVYHCVYQTYDGLFEFSGGPTNLFSQKTLDYMAGPGSVLLYYTLPCQPTFKLHTACQEMLKAASLALQLGELGFWKEYRPFWLSMQILQFNSCWSLKYHNSYRQVNEWVHIYIDNIPIYYT